MSFIARTIREAGASAELTLLGEISHKFQPQGVTAIALLAESHLSVHTWPEHGYAAAELEGQHVSVLHTEEQVAQVEALLQATLSGEATEGEEVGHRRRDGTLFPTLMSGSAIRDCATLVELE